MGDSIGAWLLLALGGVCAGFSKTAVAGAATLAVAIFALILPARESTGVLLLLLIVGDLVSISIYRRDARWDIIVRLIGPVLVGIGLGAVFLSRVDGVVMRRTIGWILLALTGFQLYLGWRQRRSLRRRRDVPTEPEGSDGSDVRDVSGATAHSGRVFGFLAGFTTMVANAGGPPMSLYLLRSNLSVINFVGTLSWFFFAVNLTKLPISVGLGLVRPARITLCLTLIPAVLLGAYLGHQLERRIDRVAFDRLVIGFVVVSSAYLALR
ncbi:sulfite exporter TauE/SafE family protein [Arsenicicoccus piscis]|uniref:Probable membrane transporter protein n=1 Tax=Arsenicicoccus piscis TaxID=673954 RepID=A0ABQ6HU96_9MICO|nr:sulfite exporter TauE/SafE family protein [Arsenicicoccus piscis]MCH8627451.1 sulfite exporter TauE/SafE family protein [Arsenicicoccus piscis]GMA21616.1 UPF0721 transmembrane protein [Arsenicicoccus piscis]